MYFIFLFMYDSNLLQVKIFDKSIKFAIFPKNIPYIYIGLFTI